MRDPACLSCELVAAPGSTIAARRPDRPRGPSRSTAAGSERSDLPRRPAGRDGVDALGRALAARGVALTTRDALAHPERYAEQPDTVTVDSLRALALVALIVALGLLEVVLLAGTAFAVGARRQTRELGLVAASGGSPRDVRRIVLAQGLVLGAIGAALGVAAGFAIAFAGRPLWERLADSEITGWAFGPAEIAVAALVGLLSGLAAAVLPALGAGRMRPVNALAGRFRATARRAPPRRPGGRRPARRRRGLRAARRPPARRRLRRVRARARAGPAHRRLRRRRRRRAARSRSSSAARRSRSSASCCWRRRSSAGSRGWRAPAAVGAARRPRRRAPPPPHGPGDERDRRRRHRLGRARVHARRGVSRRRAALPAAAAAEHAVGHARRQLDERRCCGVASSPPRSCRAARRHPLSVPLGPLPADARRPGECAHDARMLYADQQPGTCPSGRAARTAGASSRSGATAASRSAATTRRRASLAGPGFDAAARDALADGKALVFARAACSTPRATSTSATTSSGARRALPGHVVRSERAYGALPAALVSRRTARAQGWDVRTDSVLVTYGASATRDDVDAAVTAAVDAGAGVAQDDAAPDPKNLVLLLVAIAAAFVTLVGVAISVALSAAEGRADLATLAAVGAPPSRRRGLMASQALLVGGLGLRARRRLRDVHRVHRAHDDRLAGLRRAVGEPRRDRDRRAAAGGARRRALHARPAAARAPRGVGR